MGDAPSIAMTVTIAVAHPCLGGVRAVSKGRPPRAASLGRRALMAEGRDGAGSGERKPLAPTLSLAYPLGLVPGKPLDGKPPARVARPFESRGSRASTEVAQGAPGDVGRGHPLKAGSSTRYGSIEDCADGTVLRALGLPLPPFKRALFARTPPRPRCHPLISSVGAHPSA